MAESTTGKSPYEVMCPKCQAASGERCRSRISGLRLGAEAVHAARVKAVEPATLGTRHVQVLKGLSEGKTFDQIATCIDLSVASVKRYAEISYDFLGASTAAGAVGEAYRRRILEVPDA